MPKTDFKNNLVSLLANIRVLVAELRQTEALEAQVHEMVVMKRNRLDSLMTEFLDMAASSALPEASGEPITAITPTDEPVVAPSSVATTAPVANPHPVPKPASIPTPAPRPSAPQHVNELPLSPHGNLGAPKDLLQHRPAPSAQHVLDSLNRLMKDISNKQPGAA